MVSAVLAERHGSASVRGESKGLVGNKEKSLERDSRDSGSGVEHYDIGIVLEAFKDKIEAALDVFI